MPSWPASLPKLCNIRPEPPVDNLIRSETDTGPAKLRRRTTAVPRFLRGDIYPDGQQRIEFENFWNDEIDSGSVAFTWAGIDQIDDSDREVRLERVDEAIVDGSASIALRRFRIGLRVEILP